MKIKSGSVVVLGIDDLITESLCRRAHDVNITDFCVEAKIAIQKSDFAVFTDYSSFAVIKDRWGVGYMGRGIAGMVK